MQTPAFIDKNKILITSLLLFVFNFLIKIYGISSNEIAMDEPFSIFYAQMDLHSIFKMLASENNPALHFVLLHFWIKIFGIGAFSVRFLSVLFSSMTVVVIYLTGRKFFSYQSGIFAAFIFTMSQFNLYYSHEARVYPIFIFLTALSLYFFLLICHEPRKKSAYLGLAITNIFLVYSHYFGFFVVATEIFSMFFIGNFHLIYKKLTLVFLSLAVSYIPNFIIFSQRFIVSVQQGTWVRKPEFTELYGNLNRFLNSRWVMLVFLICTIVNISVILQKKQLKLKVITFLKNTYSRIIIIWFIFPYCTMFALSFLAPMFLDRYIIYISISFYLLMAVLMSKFNANRILKYISFFSILIAMMWNFSLTPDNNRRVDELVQTVKEMKAKDRNMILIISPEYSFMEFSYHYDINYFKDYQHTLSLLNRDNIYPLRDLNSFDKSKLNNRKVVYLDCGTDFAFGKNPVMTELKASHREDSTIYIFKIYTLHRFSANKELTN
jgi:mannosyltransferase